ncbi:hypothetical protein ABNC90_19895 [Paenibacillus larvae]|uniref:Uncharacterized protein n=3 Tax=Paenibacillus larvae TaxID=1464 RepID=V9W699_9BACL|nr:hypothetical protein [Paenibacillus larvae]AHD05673.1 hypothetical protein ERIC2_c18700 [Paenibacillus larvae subsp. larvae DSM 25430]AVG12218.1 hypothetical protein ERICII_01831 [Paenibacillus larvae subsp. larvae DSM 25430]MDR5570114.1 hypothetical protein [Paenibacillus larvae]MDR5583493.1 hypothetical protein [Paenibacillus larvae]MDR5595966.1 hypothetical protein [Paenibacillus larvae]
MNKILSVMDTTKKKVGAAILCSALIFAIGTGTTLASASKIDSTESGTLAVKSENGVRSYSTMSIISVVMLTAFAVIYSLTYNNMQIDNQNKLHSVPKQNIVE